MGGQPKALYVLVFAPLIFRSYNIALSQYRNLRMARFYLKAEGRGEVGKAHLSCAVVDYKYSCNTHKKAHRNYGTAELYFTFDHLITMFIFL